MKKILAVAGALALAACGGTASEEADVDATTVEEDTVASGEAGFEAVAPGGYEIVHADGRIDAMTVSPGMIWSMVYSDNQIGGGTIFMQGGETCFVTEGVEGHQCFAGSEPAEDGSIEVTGADGETAIVRPAD